MYLTPIGLRVPGGNIKPPHIALRIAVSVAAGEAIAHDLYINYGLTDNSQILRRSPDRSKVWFTTWSDRSLPRVFTEGTSNGRTLPFSLLAEMRLMRFRCEIDTHRSGRALLIAVLIAQREEHLA